MDNLIVWVKDPCVTLVPKLTPKGYAYKAALEAGLLPNPSDRVSDSKFNHFWGQFLGALSDEQAKVLRANDQFPEEADHSGGQ